MTFIVMIRYKNVGYHESPSTRESSANHLKTG